jgi:CDP-diacylglycerol--glycerol-3-phosphate 3-phosphatidyltransferase
MIPAWKQTLPLHLTFSRVYFLPLMIPAILKTGWTWDIAAAVLFILLSLTDAWDGALARRWNVVSTFGKFMDPVADKILVSSVLLTLLSLQKVDLYLVLLFIARDTFIGGVRAIAAADHLILDAKSAGKWKTGFQMTGIVLVILESFPWAPWFGTLGRVVLWISVVLSLFSGYQYWQAYQDSKKPKGA